MVLCGVHDEAHIDVPFGVQNIDSSTANCFPLTIQDSKTFSYPAYQPSGISKHFAILSLIEEPGTLTIQDSKTFSYPG